MVNVLALVEVAGNKATMIHVRFVTWLICDGDLLLLIGVVVHEVSVLMHPISSPDSANEAIMCPPFISTACEFSVEVDVPFHFLDFSSLADYKEADMPSSPP